MVTPEHKIDHNLTHRCYEFFRDKTPYPKYDKSDAENPNGYDNRHNHSIMAGMIKTPFGDLWDNFFSYQGERRCGDIELNMMNCLEAYGLPQSYQRCRDYLDDYRECISGYLEHKRCMIMRDERRRQWKAGEREIKYAVPPKLWSWDILL